MKTKFKEFLNEYGGPGKTIGFRYSEPTSEYSVSLSFAINKNVIDIKDVESLIKTTLDENDVEEDSITITESDSSFELVKYDLEITMKGYSKYELIAMFNLVLEELTKTFDSNNFMVIQDSINAKGPDIKKEQPISSYRDTKIGFKK
jgi:hypothetical protein